MNVDFIEGIPLPFPSWIHLSIKLLVSNGIYGLKRDMPSLSFHILRHIVIASELGVEPLAGQIIVGLREYGDIFDIPENVQNNSWNDSLIELYAQMLLNMLFNCS